MAELTEADYNLLKERWREVCGRRDVVVLDVSPQLRARLAWIGFRDSVGIKLAYTRWPVLADAWWRLCGMWRRCRR